MNETRLRMTAEYFKPDEMRVAPDERCVLIGFLCSTEEGWAVGVCHQNEDGSADPDPIFVLPMPDDPAKPLTEKRMDEVSYAIRELFSAVGGEPVRGEHVKEQPVMKTKAQLKAERRQRRRPH